MKMSSCILLSYLHSDHHVNSVWQAEKTLTRGNLFTQMYVEGILIWEIFILLLHTVVTLLTAASCGRSTYFSYSGN